MNKKLLSGCSSLSLIESEKRNFISQEPTFLEWQWDVYDFLKRDTKNLTDLTRLSVFIEECIEDVTTSCLLGRDKNDYELPNSVWHRLMMLCFLALEISAENDYECFVLGMDSSSAHVYIKREAKVYTEYFLKEIHQNYNALLSGTFTRREYALFMADYLSRMRLT